jgi:hypothetical protein
MDHDSVLYGAWKDGKRTPGIVEYIQAAQEAKQTSERNRTLLWTTLITAATGLALRVFELIGSAHGIGK